MWALGDKVASTIVAQTLEIPTLPWSGSGECLLTAPTPSLLPPSLLPASPSPQSTRMGALGPAGHTDWGPHCSRGILEMGCTERREMMESSAPWAVPP